MLFLFPGQGVLVPGLGTFAVVHEQINGIEEVYVVRRPVFQLDMDTSCLRELVFPAVMMPGEKGSSPIFGGTVCPLLFEGGGNHLQSWRTELNLPQTKPLWHFAMNLT